MNLHCLECGKPVSQTPGKRAKSYCNNTCRVKYWKKQKEMSSAIAKRKPGRPKKNAEYAKKMAKAIFDAPKSDPRDLSKIKGIADPRIFEGPMKEVIQAASTNNSRLGIEAIIAAIKAEKIPEHRSKSSMGRKSWELDQKKRIEKLEAELINLQ